jgi:hypothetical protein
MSVQNMADTPDYRRKLADELADSGHVTHYFVLLAVINGGDAGITRGTRSMH